MGSDRPINVVFVCLGNICRSPTAEGVFRDLVARQGLAERIRTDSAGTGGWHVGATPDRRAQAAARARGVEIGDLKARRFTAHDFGRFDYVLAMDHDNLSDLERMRPPGTNGHLGLFLDFAPAAGRRDVPDPYYGGVDGFETVLDLVEAASQGLLDHIRGKGA